MKVYKIFTDSQGCYEAVKQGWSWSAFGLTFFWAVGKKICKVSTMSMSLLGVLSALAFIASAITPEVAIRLSSDLVLVYTGYLLLGFSVFMGLNGNQWHEKMLMIQGYHSQELLVATSVKEAIALHVKHNDENDLLLA